MIFVFALLITAPMTHILESYLKENNITQSEMAARLGVYQSMVSQWICGTRPVSAKKAKAIEVATKGALQRHQLRPDIFDAPTPSVFGPSKKRSLRRRAS